MRSGNAKLIFNEKGDIKAISTGSDACAEHECGIKKILESLTSNRIPEIAAIAALKAGLPVSYPQDLDFKRITQFPKELQFVEMPNQALLSFSNYPIIASFLDLQFYRDSQDIAAAWCEDGFAFRVCGAKAVQALKEMYAAMLAKEVLFAGTFLKEAGVSGIVLGIESRLDITPEQRQKAQTDYQDKLRLIAMDDSANVIQAMMKAGALLSNRNGHFGYLWAVWADASKTSILYALNPGYQERADYYGPYTRDQLMDWATSGRAYRLTPLKVAA